MKFWYFTERSSGSPESESQTGRQVYDGSCSPKCCLPSSISPPASVSVDPSSEYFVSIPKDLISFATLEYLGYEHQTTTHIWERWTNWPAGAIKRECDDREDGMSFIEVAEGILDPAPDTCDEDDSKWFQHLDQYGMNAEDGMPFTEVAERQS